MRRLLLFLGTGYLLACGPTDTAQVFRYPETRQVEQVDVYHGVEVRDPYRWLEDLDSEETHGWVKAQNEVTFGYLETIPARRWIAERLTELWNYEKIGVPSREGGRYFFSRNDGLQNQDVLYVAESLEGEARVLLDPNTLSPDGTVALTSYEVSPDGRYLAYGLSEAGSDWQQWKVRSVDSGEDLQDHLRWIKFSGASWSHDNAGFFYCRYDEPQEARLENVNYFQKVYYHRVGTPQSEDLLVYERPDQKEWIFRPRVSDDGRYLVLEVGQGTDVRNRVFYKDLRRPQSKVVELLNEFDASYDFVGNEGPIFWFLTNLEAPRGRLIAIDIRRPQREHWKTLIPQAAETLRSVSVVGDLFIADYLQDAHSQVKLYDLAGGFQGEIELPALGTVRGFTGKREDAETFYVFTNFSHPGSIFRYDLKEKTSTLFRQPQVKFDPQQYETEQVFYSSKDGTRVPMFISYRKGLRRDGNNPTLLYGYGGFNIPLTPSFSVANLLWMEMGGVYAQPNLRGGGEYGEEWHKAGTKANKQNVFDDFMAAAEYLIREGYTSTSRLGIYGRSNGGLLTGACLTQRPDLFGAVVVGVGVLDMLRFHKFTIGWAWVSDYGSPDNPEDFQALYAYSPYHNIKPGVAYPPTLIVTADHDDRVVPAHSFKFAAALQAAQAGPEPVLIRIEERAGHGAGKPTAKRIEEATDILAFLADQLGMTGPWQEITKE